VLVRDDIGIRIEGFPNLFDQAWRQRAMLNMWKALDFNFLTMEGEESHSDQFYRAPYSLRTTNALWAFHIHDMYSNWDDHYWRILIV
jgi:hypothetical protein